MLHKNNKHINKRIQKVIACIQTPKSEHDSNEKSEVPEA